MYLLYRTMDAACTAYFLSCRGETTVRREGFRRRGELQIAKARVPEATHQDAEPALPLDRVDAIAQLDNDRLAVLLQVVRLAGADLHEPRFDQWPYVQIGDVPGLLRLR